MTTMFAEINSNLGLRELPLSYGEYAQLAYNVFANPRTLVFLDTNLLAVPFRFHNAARKGFFNLLRSPISENRLRVPAWASNEFFFNAFKANSSEHGFAGHVKKNLGTLPSRDHIMTILSRSASETELLNLATKYSIAPAAVLDHIAKFFTDGNDAITRLGTDLDPDLVHAELDSALQGCYLALDFDRHCGLVESHADRRRANRIPPGLTDGGKGDSERRGPSAGNVDGDLALWLEILDATETLTGRKAALQPAKLQNDQGGNQEAEAANKVSLHQFDSVIILCEEKKGDFLYAPKQRLKEPAERAHSITPTKNDKPRISLVDPRLVSEFESRIGHRNLAFLNMEHIADGWLRSHATVHTPLATEIRAFVIALTQQKDSAKENATAESAPVPQPAATPLHLPEENLAVAEQEQHVAQDDLIDVPAAALNNEKEFIQALPESRDKEIIEQINIHNWYVQNPAVQALIASGVPADLGNAFLMGRAVYQAADGSAWRAAKFIADYDEWASGADDYQQAFLAGAAYEALFDSKGNLRNSPKSSYLEEVMSLLQDPRWSRALQHVLRQLADHANELYWLPGQEMPEVKIEIQAHHRDDSWVVDDVVVKINGYADNSVLRVMTANEILLQPDYRKETILTTVAKQLLLPEQNVNLTYAPPEASNGPLVFSDEKGFDPSSLRAPVRV